jgi:hypothetical protein
LARVGLWRLNSVGVTAVQNSYRQGKWVTVAAFCASAGVSRSTYYELIGRSVWFERPSIEDKLVAFGLSGNSLDGYIEQRNDQAQYAPAAEKSHNNLPREMTSFIGRQQELTQISRLVRSAP